MRKKTNWNKEKTAYLIVAIAQLSVVFSFRRLLSLNSKISIILISAVEAAILTVFVWAHFRTVSKKRKVLNQDESTVLTSAQEMERSVNNLVNKAASLNETYSAEKEKITNLTENIKKFTPVKDIAAIKLEQNIIWKMTEVSSACGSALAGKQMAASELKTKLKELEKLIDQRKAFEAQK